MEVPECQQGVVQHFHGLFLPVRKNRAGALKILITVKFTVGFNGIC